MNALRRIAKKSLYHLVILFGVILPMAIANISPVLAANDPDWVTDEGKRSSSQETALNSFADAMLLDEHARLARAVATCVTKFVIAPTGSSFNPNSLDDFFGESAVGGSTTPKVSGKAQVVVVGYDLDTTNGAISCPTAITKGMGYIYPSLYASYYQAKFGTANLGDIDKKSPNSEINTHIFLNKLGLTKPDFPASFNSAGISNLPSKYSAIASTANAAYRRDSRVNGNSQVAKKIRQMRLIGILPLCYDFIKDDSAGAAASDDPYLPESSYNRDDIKGRFYKRDTDTVAQIALANKRVDKNGDPNELKDTASSVGTGLGAVTGTVGGGILGAVVGGVLGKFLGGAVGSALTPAGHGVDYSIGGWINTSDPEHDLGAYAVGSDMSIASNFGGGEDATGKQSVAKCSNLTDDVNLQKLVFADLYWSPTKKAFYDKSFGKKLWTDDGTKDNFSTSGDDCKIGIPVVGWIICGIFRFTLDTASKVTNAVTDWMGNSSSLGDISLGGENLALDQTVGALKNLANIIFLIAFLVVIFQYITGIGVADAYFVKKFLPRLIVAVVLVQASMFIVSLMNGFTSDLGESIGKIITAGIPVSSVGSINIPTGNAALGGALAATSGTGLVALGIGFALLIAVAVIILMLIVVVVLGIRQVLLLLLTILAPLAFACFALPQLEGYARKWLKFYATLLAMYPIIKVFLAVGAIISGVLTASDNPLMQVIGTIAAFAPYIILPFTFKMAEDAFGAVGKALNKGRGAATGQARKAYDRSSFAQNRAAGKKAKDNFRAERAHHNTLKKIAEGRGSVGRFADDKERQIAAAQHAQEALRVEAAKEQAQKAQVAGHGLKYRQRGQERQNELLTGIDPATGGAYINPNTGAIYTAKEARDKWLDELTDQANTTTDQQEFNAIVQELSRQKADGHIAGIQANAASAGGARASMWNSAVGDNDTFGAMTSLNYGLGTAVNPGHNATQVANSRLETFIKKNDEGRASASKDAWKDAVNTALAKGTPDGDAEAQSILESLERLQNNPTTAGKLNINLDDLEAHAATVETAVHTPAASRTPEQNELASGGKYGRP